MLQPRFTSGVVTLLGGVTLLGVAVACSAPVATVLASGPLGIAFV